MMEGNPLVSILLAAYRPNEDFLSAQLCSLAALEYDHLEILICDDSADDTTFELISRLAEQTLQGRRYRLLRNDQNLGSTGTFARLTSEASGSWLAYSDQDDIWEKNKINVLLDLATRENALLVYSDLSLMDSAGNPLGLRFWTFCGIQPLRGEDGWRQLIRRNCVTGCTMMVRAEVAKMALPFPGSYIHDQWMALNASVSGRIAYTEDPLVRYRLHSANQVGVGQLSGIFTKKDYMNRLEAQEGGMYETVAERFANHLDVMTELNRFRKGLETRIQYIERPTIPGMLKILRQKRIPMKIRGFEILLGISGKGMAQKLLTYARR